MGTKITFLFFFRVNWPTKEFSKSALHDERYNTLYYMNDPKGNFRMFRWIDNNIVKMVSNIHMGSKDEVVMKPRKNQESMNSIENIYVLYGEMITSYQSRYQDLSTIIICECLVLISLINSLHTIDQKFVVDEHGCHCYYIV